MKRKSQFVVKLLGPTDRAKHGPWRGRQRRLLRKGSVVRRSRKFGLVDPCSPSAVHAYRTLAQARCNDQHHCSHGSRGRVWLAKMAVYIDTGDKLCGKSYVLVRYLGRLREVKTTTAYRKLHLG